MLAGLAQLEGLDGVCADALATHGCPSVSVAVAERGEVVHAAAYGTADLATGRPATPGTAYGLGSITKPVTATAVCVAADAGLLDLDAPVPPASDAPAPRDGGVRAAPTARQLLQHRGGFAAHYDWDYGDGARRIDADRYTVPHREPGTAFEYANLGYRVLGRLLEEATGQELGAFVRDRVFAPLGLTACHLGRTYPGPAPSAVRHTVDGRPYPDYGCSHPGATLGWATAGQLALFAQSFDRLLTPDTAAAMRGAHPVNRHLGYGLGWCVSTGAGPVVLSHGGGGGGVAVMVAAVPERRLSVAVLTNSTDKAARDAVVGYVLDALVPGFAPEQISPAPDDPARPVTLPEGEWSGVIGTPEGEVPVALRVREGGRAELRLDGRSVLAPALASEAYDLRAEFTAQLPTADARVSSPLLGLELRLEEGRLTGTARAYKSGDAEGLLGNLLSHRCVMDRR
ncbi:serine hydrolase domain-containing protein [Streptomyces sp. NPDC047108]|uniref:serine hydrolase domain-containing protein n=1 Tax=Streptomyces sp. NPDC047108 TaxID=3155025 RepID=UPI0033EB4662